MNNRLQGKTIIVAGAGGIGNELARRYAAEGANLVLGDLDAQLAKATAEAITQAGNTAIGVELDGADDDSVKQIVGLAIAKFGGLDGFHANFGNFSDTIGDTSALGVEMEVFDEVMRVNTRGFLLCTRHALPAMIARGGGTMLYTSSGAVYIGEPVRVAYAMSKEACHALMRHVARRYGPQGIRANTISPGVIAHARFEEMVPPDIAQGFMDVTALKTRLGRPADIAAMGALLMSDEGSYITGQILNVDGGHTMRP